MERSERRRNYIEYLHGMCPYFANMTELGRMATKLGGPPEQFPSPLIRSLKAGIYSVDVFFGDKSGTVALMKMDPDKLRLYPIQCADLTLEIHSNGRVEATANVLKEPESVDFKRPTGRGVMFEPQFRVFLEMHAAANRFCPKTLEYFDKVTEDALKVFREAFPGYSNQDSSERYEVLLDFQKTLTSREDLAITAGEQ
jgi:hypothetical protein